MLGNTSVSTAKVTEGASLLSPTEATLDAWNPMESHFLSNWNLYKENTSDALLEDGGRGNYNSYCWLSYLVCDRIQNKKIQTR